MDKRLRQRLIGAAVLIALAVIFLPMLLTGRGSNTVSKKIELPPEPDYHFTNNNLQPAAPEAPQRSITSLSVIPDTGTMAPPSKATMPGNVPQPVTSSVPNPTPPKSPANLPLKSKTVQLVSTPAKPVRSIPPPRSVTSPVGKPVVSAWVVQVASLVDDHAAERLRERLLERGFPAYIDRYSNHDKNYFRVRVGPRLSHAEAEKIQMRIQQSLKLKGMVVPYQ